MPKNTNVIRLQRRVADCERKLADAVGEDGRKHRQQILTQRRRILARALNRGTGWQATHKMKVNGHGRRDRLVAARLGLRGAEE